MGRPSERGRTQFRRPRKSRLGLWLAVCLLVVGAAYLALLESSRPHVTGDRLRFDTFVDLVERGQISDARILDVDSYVVGTYMPAEGEPPRPYNAPYVRDSKQRLLDILIENRIPLTIDQQDGKRLAEWANLPLAGLVTMMIFAYLILSYRRGTGLFSINSGARQVKPSHQDRVTFADVAGQDAAIGELKELKHFLADPDRFREMGASIPKGVLLYGPPGCGKTLLARALAGEAGASFFSISGSDFVELYAGVGASRVRDLFREARANAPAIVFIDELDVIGRARGASETLVASAEQEQSLAQILAEMDGFSHSDGVMVLAATNRPDILDRALLRPGRFDRTIGLERPDENGRLAILELHAKGKRMSADVKLAALARQAIGLTGADLANVVNEAVLAAIRANRRSISQADLDQALRRTLQEPERQRRLTLRDRGVAKRFTDSERVTFADVAGVDEAIEELSEVKSYLAKPEHFIAIGARPPRGILLAGPPGCGKTMLARAVAGEANAAFLSVAGSEFVEVFAGEGASRVRELFAEARALAPAIVFIDEIDAVGARRGASVDGHREREQTLNQILVELDGFEARSAVIVMAATNRPDILDAALIRPGRFDRQVEISLPDRSGRRAILALHARGKRLGPDVDLDVVAGLTRGFSGADLANVLNEAALLATRRGQTEITMALVEEGIDRATFGVASRGHIMTDQEREMVAYHEAGHALVGRALPGAAPPHKLTIVARGRSLGHSTHLSPVDRLVQPRSALIDEMATALGGRVAEELVFGEPGTGAASDIQRASEIARWMVCELGMSEALGAVRFVDGNGSETRGSPFSDEAARMIDTEVRALVDEAQARARAVLSGSRAVLDRVATSLLERETITATELDEIAGPLPGVEAPTNGESPRRVSSSPESTPVRLPRP